jgi:hypothetical protein
VAVVKFDEEDPVLFQGQVEKYVNSQRGGESRQEWQARHVKLTTERLLFSFEEGGVLREDVDLLDIDAVESTTAKSAQTENAAKRTRSLASMEGTAQQSSLLSGLEWANSFRVHTGTHGRNYYLRTRDQEQRDAWVEAIEVQRERLARTLLRKQASLTKRVRPVLKGVVEDAKFSVVVAFILTANFFLNIYEVEVKPDRDSRSGVDMCVRHE